MYTSQEIEELFPKLQYMLKSDKNLFLNAYLRLSMGARLLQPQRLRFEGNLYNPINRSGAINITRRSKWGNPYKVEEHGLQRALISYEQDLLEGRLAFGLEDVRAELRGRDLICWCAVGSPCHGDILISYANF